MNNAKKLRLRFREGDLDLPGKRKKYISSREEEEDVATNICPCGTIVESRTHKGECEMYKEERDAFEE